MNDTIWSDEDIDYQKDESVETVDSVTAWMVAERQLNELFRLRPDWDGRGADPVNPPRLLFVRHLFAGWRESGGRPPSAVIPGPTGEVFLEWYDGDVRTVAEVTAELAIEWMRTEPGRPAEHWLTRPRQWANRELREEAWFAEHDLLVEYDFGYFVPRGSPRGAGATRDWRSATRTGPRPVSADGRLAAAPAEEGSQNAE